MVGANEVANVSIIKNVRKLIAGLKWLYKKLVIYICNSEIVYYKKFQLQRNKNGNIISMQYAM